MAVTELAIRVLVDASQAARGLGQAGSGLERFTRNAQRAAVPAAALLGVLGKLGSEAFNSASRLEQASGAVESVFGKQAAAVKNLAAEAATGVGLAKSEYSELASVLGSQLKNLGTSQDQIVGKTSDLIKMGADLAATFGGTTSEAVEALSSLFRGEADPIERYGVSIKQSDINARLAAKGLSKLTGDALRQAETTERLAMLTEQTTAAQGAFARESETAAGAQQRMSAAVENSKAAIGEALLPVVSALAGHLQGMATWAQQNATTVQILAAVLGALAVAVLAVNAGLAVYKAYTVAATAVTWLLGAANIAAWGWVVIAVIAVIAVIVLLWNKCDWFRNAVGAVIRWVASAWDWVVAAVKVVISWIGGQLSNALNIVKRAFELATLPARTAFNAVSDAISTVVGWVKNLISWISNIRWPSPPGWLSNLNPFGASMIGVGFSGVPMAVGESPGWINFAATPWWGATRTGATAGSGVTVVQNWTVNVDGSGIVDADRVGEQVTKALSSYRRTLGIPATAGF